MNGSQRQSDVLRRTLRRVQLVCVAVGALSCVINILMLTGPMFMLQVYDRVLTSQSIPTLVALLGLTAALYAMMGLFDFFRVRVLSRVAHWMDGALAPLAFRSWMIRSISGYKPGYRPLQDLAGVRQFLTSPTVMALFDLPWFPIYLGVIYLLHVELGLLATAGAVVVIVMALINDFISSRGIAGAGDAEQTEARFSDQSQLSADSVLAMGMLGSTQAAWTRLHGQAAATLQIGSERSEIIAAMSKAFRLLLQSAILGYGAWLAIRQEISPGTIVAASIIAGRALAPIDQVTGGWRMIKRSRLGYLRLRDYLERDSSAEAPNVRLPDPKGNISVSSVTKFAPRIGTEDPRAILTGIDFKLEPGDGLGVIGPSASGKTTLARLLVGLWMPDRGAVRIDGATLEQWDIDHIGRHIGYLPQSVGLLSGSIAQNIARFDENPDQTEIVEAAKLAGVHEMILGFPDGYGTEVDSAVSPLTGGQVQRIALARAVYCKPRLVVLDEPNSNLDADGDEALGRAISALREDGSVVVVMAHRPSAIAAVDKVLMLNKGQMVEFGSKQEVIRRVTQST